MYAGRHRLARQEAQIEAGRYAAAWRLGVDPGAIRVRIDDFGNIRYGV